MHDRVKSYFTFLFSTASAHIHHPQASFKFRFQACTRMLHTGRKGMGWYGIKRVDTIHRYGMIWGLEVPYHNGMVRDFSGIIP